jgi:hypothetical protein
MMASMPFSRSNIDYYAFRPEGVDRGVADFGPLAHR